MSSIACMGHGVTFEARLREISYWLATQYSPDR